MTSIIDAVWSLRTAMRRLWADHATWTRQYIVAAVAGTPDAEYAAVRLLKNQEDIGNAIVPYYGEEAGPTPTGRRRTSSTSWSCTSRLRRLRPGRTTPYWISHA